MLAVSSRHPLFFVAAAFVLIGPQIPFILASDAEEQLVVALDESFVFDDFLRNNRRVLVNFYRTSCQHCRRFEPIYLQAANSAKAAGLITRFANVGKGDDLRRRYNITAVPTVIYFVDKKKTLVYPLMEEGGASSQGITKWLRRQEAPAVTELTEALAEEFLSSAVKGRFAILARVRQASARAKAFFSAAEVLAGLDSESFKCGVVWAIPSGQNTLPPLVMRRLDFKEPNPRDIVFAGSWSSSSLARWARNGTYELVGNNFSVERYGPEIHSALGWDGVVVVLHSDSALEEDDEELPLKPQLVGDLFDLAISEPRWRVTTADIAALRHADRLALGARPNNGPMVSILRGFNKFVLEGEEHILKPQGISSFLQLVKQGKVRPVYKSAEAPVVDVDDAGVVELVGSTFADVALDPAMDVFVNFYAPNCEHCASLAPAWRRLAKQVNASGWRARGVVIARMDGVANEAEETEELKRHGFPRLVLYTAVKAEKQLQLKRVFMRPRPQGHHEDLDPFIDFLRDHAKNLVKGSSVEKVAPPRRKYSMVERELERKKAAHREVSEAAKEEL